MTTDPGDLVLDPTCGSGTTAHVAEQWGRRWITTDTSRVALNIAKTRLMTASYPWYTLQDEKKGLPREHWDLRHGFVYKSVQRITLGSLANDEPPEDRDALRPAGGRSRQAARRRPVHRRDAAELRAAGARGRRGSQPRPRAHGSFPGARFRAPEDCRREERRANEMAVFARVDALPDSALHAEGYYDTAEGEQKAYIHLGPQFAPVSRQAVNDAVLACRARGDAQWLLILGFAFESDVDNRAEARAPAASASTKVRMHDDLLQAGLTKKDKKAATFVTIGEPDIALLRDGDTACASKSAAWTCTTRSATR
jgi:adenine-specific DNA-methyltransferase